MKKYQFQIVRYIHDRTTGEFVNVGIVVYVPETKFLKAKFVNKFSRLSNFFLELNGLSLIKTLRHFNKEIKTVSKRMEENDLFENFSSIEEITNNILTKDDSALVCCEMKLGIDVNGQAALDDLFERIINRYNQETDNDIHDDLYVWRQVYKKYFDDNEITPILTEHDVHTDHDVFHFDKAWKNGVWNCFQALSFDLKKTESIRNKIYKWSGILREIEKSNESLHLYFLTVNSTKDTTITEFIEDTLISESENFQVSIVTEDSAADFAKSVKKEIEAHKN